MVEYPERQYAERVAATVRVELRFDAADAAPRVRFVDRDDYGEFHVAVQRYAASLRLPCLKAERAPVTLRQDYVFVPNDRRKVVASLPRDNALAEAEAAGKRRACIGPKGDTGGLHYPPGAVRQEAQGVVLARARFDSADTPPKFEILAAPRSRDLRWSAEEFMSRLRNPCHDGVPTTVTWVLQYNFPDGKRFRLHDTNLVELLAHAEAMPLGVYFDLSKMKCPFDLRITYYRPHLPNRVGQFDADVPERHAFMDWLSQITLRLHDEAANAVLGSSFVLSVPCAVVDL